MDSGRGSDEEVNGDEEKVAASSKEIENSIKNDECTEGQAVNKAFDILIVNKKMKDSNHIFKLSSLQSEINEKITYLAQLKDDYNQKEEKMFLKTFVNIMDRMSNELLEQKRLYNNIDEEINRDPDCIKLQEKLNFYTQECLALKSEL